LCEAPCELFLILTSVSQIAAAWFLGLRVSAIIVTTARRRQTSSSAGALNRGDNESVDLQDVFGVGLMSLAAALASAAAGYSSVLGPAVVVMFAALAVAFMSHAALRGVAFTIWVLAFVAASLFYPAAFGKWFDTDLKILIVPLIQIIMFGMGTTLSVKDFTRVLALPWPVFVGMVLQFSIMPLVGLSIATAFGFEPEIAAGVILIGSVPGGVASNLMTYLARGDVALSVTMTACSTLLSPVMTPLLMKVLAGRLVPIDFWEMMLSILDMVIVPRWQA